MPLTKNLIYVIFTSKMFPPHKKAKKINKLFLLNIFGKLIVTKNKINDEGGQRYIFIKKVLLVLHPWDCPLVLLI